MPFIGNNVDAIFLPESVNTSTSLRINGGDLTVSGISTFQDNVDLGDNDKLRFGDDQDLEIYHDGSVSYIRDTGTGSLLITTNGPRIRLRNGVEGEDMANFIRNGAVELYYDNSKKFETTSTGIDVTGNTETDTLNVSGTSTFQDIDVNGNLTLTGELRGPASFVIDPAAVGDNTGTVVIKGDLQVDGTTTTINSTTLTVDDLNIVLASGAADSAAADGAGITIDGVNESLTYVDSTKAFLFSTRVGVGGANTSANLRIGRRLGGENVGTYYAFLNNGAIQSDVTSNAYYNHVQVKTSNNSGTAYTISNVVGYNATVASNTISSDSTITNLAGFRVLNTWIEGTNNYGFRGQIPSGTNRWNVYMDGSAPNYFAGNVGIGTDSPQSKLDIHGTNSELRFYRDDRARFGGIRYDGSLLKVRLPQGDHLAVYNSTESLLGVIVKSTGEVGVGTIGPEEKLHVVGGSLKLDAISNLKFGAAGATGVSLRDETNILGGSLDGTLGAVTMAYLASAPSSPVQGQFYFNSLSSKAQIYTGSSFVDLVPSGGGGGGGGGSSTDANATFRKYTYSVSSTTNSITGSSDTVVSAGSFIVGYKYTIKTVGTTDFTAIGASANTVGTVFTATGAGSGTGDAYDTLFYSTGGDQNVEVYVNGVKAVEGSTNDYVATSGTSVNFVANLASGDVVDIQVYELLTNDAYVLATGGTFTGNVGINTSTINNRLHIHSNANDQGILLTQAGSNYNGLIADANRTAADNFILNLQANWNGNGVARIAMESGNDTTNKDDGRIKFFTSASGSNPQVRMHIAPAGNIGIGLPENLEASARLEVRATGNAIPTGIHRYSYANGNAGIRVIGIESAIDIVGEDAGQHGASLLLRNENEGFSFHCRPDTDSFHLHSFTSNADSFTVHNGGNNLSAIVDLMSFLKGGNVGIGSTQPTVKFDVAGSAKFVNPNPGNTHVLMQDGGSATPLKTATTLRVVNDGNSASYSTVEFESGSGKFVMLNSGNVGIGTDNPTSTLMVYGDTSSSFRIAKSGILAYDHTFDGSTYTIANNNGSGGIPIIFGSRQAGAETLRMNANGSVGIGNATAASGTGRFNVKPHDSQDCYFKLRPASDFDGLVTGSAIDIRNGANNDSHHLIARAEEYRLWCGDSSNEQIRITNTGNVGIGTNNPAAKLNVNGRSVFNSTENSNESNVPLYLGVTGITSVEAGAGATCSGVLRIKDKGANNNRFCGIDIRNRNSGDIRILNYDTGTSNQADMVFAVDVNSTDSIVEAMRIKGSTQNVGIGTVTPRQKLDVNGSLAIYKRSGTDSTRLIMENSTSNLAASARIEFWEGTHVGGVATDANAAIEYDGTTTYGGDGAILIRGYTGSANQVLAGFSRSGATHFAGNVGIGTTNPSRNLDVRGDAKFVNTSLTGVICSRDISDNSYLALGTESNNLVRLTAGSGTTQNVELAIRTANAGAENEQVRIDNVGFVGIGTNNPEAKVHIRGGANSQFIFETVTTANAAQGGPVISLGESTSEVGVSGGIAFVENITASGNNTDVTMGMYYNGISNYFAITGTANTGSTVGANLRAATHHFVVQRDAGNIGIGTASPISKLDIYGGTDSIWLHKTSNAGGVGIAFSDHSSSNPAYEQKGYFRFHHSDGESFGHNAAFAFTSTETSQSLGFTVYSQDDFTAVGTLTQNYSDERLKTIHGRIDNPLEKLSKIHGYYYTQNETADELGFKERGQRQVGVSAQEIQEVLPEVIRVAPVSYTEKAKEEYYTVQYERVIPLLIESIKAQQELIEKLQQRLDDAGL